MVSVASDGETKMHRRNSVHLCFDRIDRIPRYLRFPFQPRLDWLVDANVSGVSLLQIRGELERFLFCPLSP